MSKFGIYPKLNKQYVLDRISQEDIMEKFLGIPVNSTTLSANSISSPYRSDKHKSCNYWYNDNGKLRFKDWTYKINYDCFDVVAKELGITSLNKEGFIFVLHAIAKAFRIHKYENYNEVLKLEARIKEHKERKQRFKKIIQYKLILRKANYHDIAYWKKYHLELQDLKGVYFVDVLYMSYNYQAYQKVYTYDPKDPCYGYYGRKDKYTKVDLWKFYFPLRKKGEERSRFVSNGSFMQGIQYLVPDKICIVTKAYKDAMVFKKLGIQSCALSGETIVPSDDELFFLKTNFDFIISCLDWDRIGILMARELRKKANFTPIMFTRGKFNTIDYGSKDASDFVQSNGLFTLQSIIQKEYSKNKEELNNYLKSLNSKLNFI